MNKLCLIVILAVLSHEALGMSYRHRRQTENNDDLEDRYGWGMNWNNQGRFPQRPWRPNPNVFPPNPNPVPRPRPQPEQTTTTSTTSNPNGNPANLRACLLNCPTTTEYNPVCGSNNVSYDNPSRLFCSQACGVNVTLLRMSKCPTPTPTPTA